MEFGHSHHDIGPWEFLEFVIFSLFQPECFARVEPAAAILCLPGNLGGMCRIHVNLFHRIQFLQALALDRDGGFSTVSPCEYFWRKNSESDMPR